MLSSGPLEHFIHRKILTRPVGKQAFHLIVPAEALLWAGPFLTEMAYRLGSRGGVFMPCTVTSDDGVTKPDLVALDGAMLSKYPLEIGDPADESIAIEEPTRDVGDRLRLSAVAGYHYVHMILEEEVIWPRKHPALARPASRSGAVLMFGPPGCGKSHVARAMCGELDHEARMLAPSDLKGLYIGWGTVLVREQFDWLLEAEGRVLVIDEFDAVARSRRTGEMHADEKADVNEMLVQLDRAARSGRLVVCTTNYVAALDEAVIRSGRFGHFVPIGPPDLDAGQAIIAHYLERLRMASDASTAVELRVPDAGDIRALVARAMPAKADTSLYCGADLEEVVNRTYRRLVRRAKLAVAVPHDKLVVDITIFELNSSFEAVRRSISADTLDQFQRDVAEYAPREHQELLRTSMERLVTR
jgi:SpoVK/Ycf46/Vps4 family AAA+-type ATPase